MATLETRTKIKQKGRFGKLKMRVKKTKNLVKNLGRGGKAPRFSKSKNK